MIVAVTNQKGGVGKTTTAVNLSAALAARGHSTLLVDLDPQANATHSFLDQGAYGQTLSELLLDDSLPLETGVTPWPGGKNLDLLPADIHLAKLEAKLLGDLDAFTRLRSGLRGLVDHYDQVVLDTPPTLGLLTVNALVASSHVLIPIQSSYYALEGTDDLLDTIDKVRAHANPELQLLGVLLTIHDRRTLLARDIADRVRQVFGDRVFETTITRSVRLEEAPAYKQPVISFAPRSSGAEQYRALALEVIRRGEQAG